MPSTCARRASCSSRVNSAGAGGAHDRHDLEDRLLAVAEQEAVEEVGQRLGVEGPRPAADDERVALVAVAREQRQVRQIEHGQDVRGGQLVGQREADDVEVRQRPPRLERGERRPLAAQLLLAVDPGGEDALGEVLLAGVDDLVEDLQALVRHAELVEVGEGQRDARGGALEVLAHGVDLAVEVLERVLDQQQFVSHVAHRDAPAPGASGAGSAPAPGERRGNLHGCVVKGG